MKRVMRSLVLAVVESLVLAVVESLLLAVLALCAGGCSHKDNNVSWDSMGCVPDTTLISSARACLQDDQCPCGTHCELGQCVAQCGPTTSPCSNGLTCDRFGRCRETSEDPLIAPKTSAEGDLRLSLKSTTITSPTEPSEIGYLVDGRTISKARFAADASFEVACGDGADFASSCFLDNLTSSSQGRVRVRVAPGRSPVPTTGALTVFWGARHDVVSLEVLNATQADANVPSGVYEGTAAWTSPLTRQVLTIPIKAKVYTGTTQRLVIEDPSTLVGGDKRLQGSLTGATGGPVLVLDDAKYLDATPAVGVSVSTRLQWREPGAQSTAIPIQVINNTNLSFVAEAAHSSYPLTSAPSGRITMQRAIYAANCNRPVDVLLTVAAQCDGRASCTPNLNTVADPALNCLKKLDLTYTCDELKQPYQMSGSDGSFPSPSCNTQPSSTGGVQNVVSWTFRLQKTSELPAGTPPPAALVPTWPKGANATSDWTARLSSALRTTPTDLTMEDRQRLVASLTNPADASGRLLDATGPLATTLTAATVLSWAEQSLYGSAPSELVRNLNSAIANPPAVSLPAQSTAFPCAGTVSETTIGSGTSGSGTSGSGTSGSGTSGSGSEAWVIPSFAVDRCASLQDWGLLDFAMPRTTEFAQALNVSAQVGSTTYAGSLSFKANSRVLDLGGTRWSDFTQIHRGEIVLCADGLESSAFSSKEATFQAISGDLRCSQKGAGFGLPYSVGLANGLQKNTVINACFDDFARLETGPVPPTALLSGSNATDRNSSRDEAIHQLYANSGCLAPTSFLAALEGFDVGTSRGARSANRLLQLWVHLHADLLDAVSPVFRLPASMVQSGLPDVYTALPRAGNGLALLSHPVYGALFQQSKRSTVATTALASPDYRLDYALDDCWRENQGCGAELSCRSAMEACRQEYQTALASGKASYSSRESCGQAAQTCASNFLQRHSGEDQAKLVTAEVDRTAQRLFADIHALLNHSPTSLDNASVTASLRAAWFALVQSHGLELQVRGTSSTAAGAVPALQSLVSALATSDPSTFVGLSGNQIVLAYQGAPATGAERFTATSDYLLGTSGEDAWAPAAIKQAQTAEDALATAMATQEQKEVDAKLSETDRQEKIASVRQQYGEQLGALCGAPDGVDTRDLLEGWQAATGKTFSPVACFRQPDPRCSPPALASADVTRDTLLRAACANAFRRNSPEYYNGDPSQPRTQAGPKLDGMQLSAESACLAAVDAVAELTPDRKKMLCGAHSTLDMGLRRPGVVYQGHSLDIDGDLNTLGLLLPETFTQTPAALDDPNQPTFTGCSALQPCTKSQDRLCVKCRGRVWSRTSSEWPRDKNSRAIDRIREWVSERLLWAETPIEVATDRAKTALSPFPGLAAFSNMPVMAYMAADNAQRVPNPFLGWDNSSGCIYRGVDAWRCGAQLAWVQLEVSADAARIVSADETSRFDSVDVYHNAADGTALEKSRAATYMDFYNGVCARRFPSAMALTSSSSTSALDDGSCYRGTLGDMVLNIRGLALDIKAAREDYLTFYDNYDIAAKGCELTKATSDEIAEMQESHDTSMKELRAARSACDTVALAADAVKDCASTANEASLGGLFSAGVAAEVACGAAAVAAAGRIASTWIQFAMDNAEATHQLAVQRHQGEGDYKRCMNDAGLNLTGARAALVRVDRAKQELLRAYYNFNESLGAAEQIHDEGLARISELKTAVSAPQSFGAADIALIDRFTDAMIFAKRATLLAARSVAYEMQAPLDPNIQTDILAAEHAYELRAIMDNLRRTLGARRIAGSQPETRVEVISLRDHILQLADRTNFSDQEQKLTPSQRLRLLLGRPSAVERDRDGTIVGRTLKFSLAPIGKTGVQDATKIALLQGAGCAERLWSLAAAIQTTSADSSSAFYGSVQQNVPMEIRKANTFYSQWCSRPSSTSDEYQYASFRPSMSPFTQNTTKSNAADDTRSRALVRAFVNVAAHEFASDSYKDGASAELAGRGLYGSYELFIPEYMLGSAAPVDGGVGKDGLNLSAVDDILVRIEYVSVAKPMNVSCSIAGTADCDQDASTGCETVLASDAKNCGSCGMVCPANTACINSQCSSGSSLTCTAGFADCNRSVAGCETDTTSDKNNCGSCGTVCTAGRGQAASCSAGRCLVQCNPGYADCDGQPSNGCEVNLQTESKNCGLCGNSCTARDHQSATCSSGSCSFQCEASYHDCDGRPANGCESTLRDDNNCGQCGATCTGGKHCNRQGACAP